MKNSSILIVDDEPAFLRSLRRILWQEGYDNVSVEQFPREVPNLLANNRYDLILLDISMPEINGLDLLEQIGQSYPDIPVIILTALGDVKTAFKATKLGAYDFITKPPDIDRLYITIDRALQQRLLQLERDSLRTGQPIKLKERKEFADIITQSPQMHKVFDLIEIFAPTNETVLILGETGTGKDMLARKIHQLSPRKEGPFITANLVSISSTLFESELFGHEKGAFTGAIGDKTGYFEAANGGTIFLDEIGEIPKELQGKLLRTLQYNEIYKIGSSKPISLDIRFIAATNKNLLEAVEKKEFRADLYFRLNRGYIQIPPLCKRGNDIKLLAEYFLQIANQKYGKNLKGFSPEVIEQLFGYSFPGNVRELESIILNAAVQNKNDEYVENVSIPKNESTFPAEPVAPQLLTIDELVKEHVKSVLKYMNGNIQKAAVILGVSERTLQRKIQEIKREEN